MSEVEPKILYSKSFDIDSFQINHVDSRIKLSTSQLEQIDLVWKGFESEAKSKGGKVWDGTFYRLENYTDINKTLELSTVKYSTIRGLTYNQDASVIPIESRPNHISTGSLIQTSDDLFVFGVRGKSSMSKRSIDLIGGGLQSDELEVDSFRDIFRNQRKEIEEEIGVSSNHIESINGLGIVLSSVYNIIFILNTKLDINKEKLLQLFSKRSEDEMQGLEFVLEKDLENYLCDKGSYRPLVSDLYFSNR